MPVAEPAPTPSPVAPPPAGASKRNRVLGLTAQATGIIGIVLFVALAVVMLLGRGWATSTVDDISAGIDAKMAQAVPMIDNASAKVSEINGRVGALSDAADALAAQVAAAPDLLGGLRDQVANLQSRYHEFRTSYSDVRETAIAALDRLKVIDRLIPGFDIPQEPIDALTALDGRMQELDARIMEVSSAITDGPVQKVAGIVSEKAAEVRAGLTKAGTALDAAQTRLGELRAQVASTADTINTVHQHRFHPAVPAVPLLRAAPLRAVPRRPRNEAGSRRLTARTQSGQRGSPRDRGLCGKDIDRSGRSPWWR